MKISKCPECGSKDTLLYSVNRLGYMAECENCGHTDGFFHTRRGAKIAWERQGKNSRFLFCLSVLVAIAEITLIWLSVFLFFNFISRCAG